MIFFSRTDSFSIAVAAGVNDRHTGSRVTTESQFPAGSIAKPYTTVAAVRLHERGVLDLDEPVHIILDPWLKAQSQPSLLEIWDGDATIHQVTSRHLLSMQSGLRDYESGLLENWTINNPTKDYLPIDFLSALNKTFYFTPGQGGAYSSDGFVVAGMVLAAATGAKKWSDFDQLAAIGPIEPPLDGTLFMKAGACSQYPRVVHQYAEKPTGRGWGPDNNNVNLEERGTGGGAEDCDDSDQKGYALKGETFGNLTFVRNVSACCQIAKHHAKMHRKDIPFSFIPDAVWAISYKINPIHRHDRHEMFCRNVLTYYYFSCTLFAFTSKTLLIPLAPPTGRSLVSNTPPIPPR